MSRHSSYDDDDDGLSFDFQPVIQDVRGVVEARFSIDSPDLSGVSVG
jgi:hypothetical protein